MTRIAFAIGDHAAGMMVGSLTALSVRWIVWPGMDMVIAMLLGMVAGMVVPMMLAVLLAPLLGMFQTMIPAMVIGMYGGMLFAMRDAMGAGSSSLGGATAVGALLGAVIVLAISAYDRILRGTVIEAGD
jgi:hypothetical protein